MSCEFILVYSVTIFIASIVPGPSMLLALTHGMKYGVRRTMASAFGNLAVTLLQAAISIAGLGTILIASEGLFNMIKWAGAAYLVYMGLVVWRSPHSGISGDSQGVPSEGPSFAKMFLEGILVTAGNPKAIVFFTAVFPQFIHPDIAYLPQFSTLMMAGGLIAFCCFMLYAAGGQRIVTLFSRAAVVRYFNKVIGGTFIGAGIGLAVGGK